MNSIIFFLNALYTFEAKWTKATAVPRAWLYLVCVEHSQTTKSVGQKERLKHNKQHTLNH